MVEAAVGIGVIISLVFAELLGASAGGIVVPGYIAMYLDKPLQIIGTLLVSLVTWLLIRGISQFTLLYGRRRMVLAILLGFIVGWYSRHLVFHNVSIYDLEMQSIGYIVPGLIANWMERQGVIKTISTMIIAAVFVRLLIMLISVERWCSMYRPSLRTNWSLAALALLSIVLFYFANNSHRTIKANNYDLKLQAAVEMEAMMAEVKTGYDAAGLQYNILDDQNKTGLIGKSVSSITSSRGLLLDKQTAINPNFAAVYVELLKKAGVKKDDYVAVGITGSTPASNLALYAALKVVEAKPVIVTANSSAGYGANREEYTWLDIENRLFERGMINFKSKFASIGGNEDNGKGMHEIGIENLGSSIVRNNVALINGRSLEASINLRKEAYQEAIPNKSKYRTFVNIGSGLANVGTAINAKLVSNGVHRGLAEKDFTNPGIMFDFAKKGIPIIHVFRIIPLAKKYNLPVAVSNSEIPFEIQKPGVGKIFSSEVKNTFVIAICFALLLIAITLVVAFDRHDRKFAKNIVAHED